MEAKYMIFWGLCSGAVVVGLLYRGLQQRRTNRNLEITNEYLGEMSSKLSQISQYLQNPSRLERESEEAEIGNGVKF